MKNEKKITLSILFLGSFAPLIIHPIDQHTHTAADDVVVHLKKAVFEGDFFLLKTLANKHACMHAENKSFFSLFQ